MRYPDFFIVGAAKSGTTSLWRYLGTHPEIFVTKKISRKELGYFCDNYGVDSEEHYCSFFEKAEKNQLVGEVCHAYLSSPESVNLIHEKLPNSKIIMILRNPVDRAFSLYSWMVKEGYEPTNSFEKAIDIEEKRISDPNFINNNPQGFYMNYLYFESGNYYKQVKRYFEVFGKERCLILLYEDFKKDSGHEYSKLLKFLGVKDDTKTETKVHNKSFKIRSAFIQFHLKRFIKKINRNKWRRIYFIKPLLNKILFLNAAKDVSNKIDHKTGKRLMTAYKDEIERFSLMTGIDTNVWVEKYS